MRCRVSALARAFELFHRRQVPFYGDIAVGVNGHLKIVAMAFSTD